MLKVRQLIASPLKYWLSAAATKSNFIVMLEWYVFIHQRAELDGSEVGIYWTAKEFINNLSLFDCQIINTGRLQCCFC